jgi:cytochrome c553
MTWRLAWVCLVAIGCGTPATAGDVAFGEYLAAECVTCHQRSGQAHGIPAIIGWPQDQFVAVLNSYKWKERDNAVMQTIAGKLTDDEIEALAAYFESLDPHQKTCADRQAAKTC